MTEIMASPYKLAPDSPSRQLLWELNQIAVLDQKAFNSHLDQRSSVRELLHRQALAESYAWHERVRKGAEAVREQQLLREEEERRAREEEIIRELQKQRQINEKQELAARKRSEERNAAEIEAKSDAEAKKAEADAAAATRAQNEKAEQDARRAKRLQDEHKRQQHQAAAPAPANAVQTPTPAPPNASLPDQATSQIQSAPQASTAPNSQHESEHNCYLGIHRRLKELRRGMNQHAKQNSQLKDGMGRMRREIKKSVGQIREGKGTNKGQLKNIMDILKEALKLPEPSIDVPMFLASPPAQVESSNGPALLIYLLNIFAKSIVAQFVSEAGVKPKIADSVGTVASHIFAVPAFRWKDISLIDILIAKLHVTCPVLFGIFGPENTKAGKQRLGWWRPDEESPFISQEEHFKRMTGLAAGFAGISLRNYEKAQAKNPYPEYNYWTSLARIANTPTAQMTQTHFVVLRGMIDTYEERFLQFYGDAAIAALRNVLIDLPRRSPQSVPAKQLAGLVDVLKREKKLIL